MKPLHTLRFMSSWAIALTGLMVGCAKFVPAVPPIIRFKQSIPSLKIDVRPLRGSKHQEVESITISWGDGENRRVGTRVGSNVFEFTTIPELDCDVRIQMKKEDGDSYPPHWHLERKFQPRDLDGNGVVVFYQFSRDSFCSFSHCPVMYSEKVHWWNKRWWGGPSGA